MATEHPAGYERPEVKVLGSVQELTLGQDKTLGPSDGFTFMGAGICNVSVCMPPGR